MKKTEVKVENVVDAEDITEELQFTEILPSRHIEYDPAKPFMITRSGGSQNTLSFETSKMPAAVKKLSRIYFDNSTYIKLAYTVNTKYNDIKSNLQFYAIKDLKVTMDKTWHLKQSNLYTIADDPKNPDLQTVTFKEIKGSSLENEYLCQIMVDYVDIKEDIVNGNISKSAQVKMDASFTFRQTGSFTLRNDEKIDVSFKVYVGNSYTNTINVSSVMGKFDPDINPNINPLNIYASLPDFLQDKDVVVKVSNPTLKLNADMNQVPMDLDFSGTLRSKKTGEGAFTKEARIPSLGVAKMTAQQTNILYFAQQDKPYDPEGMTEGAKSYMVSNFSTLVEKLPDVIEPDFRNKQIRVNQDKEFNIHLNKSYHISLDYKIYVPLEFNKGFNIVYNDTTDSMKDDLKDYQAEGVKVTATAVNMVPLDLNATIQPLDINNKVITSIKVDKVTIPGSDGVSEKETEIAINLTLSNPADLQKVDRIMFKVYASSDDQQTGNNQLMSNQYILLKDIRARLNGPVIGDFN